MSAVNSTVLVLLAFDLSSSPGGSFSALAKVLGAGSGEGTGRVSSIVILLTFLVISTSILVSSPKNLSESSSLSGATAGCGSVVASSWCKEDVLYNLVLSCITLYLTKASLHIQP